MNDYTQAIENLSNSQNCVQIFENAELGSVRTLCIDGEPWFVGKDVADVLGYTNSRKALADHVDDEDKNTVTFRDGTPGNPNQVIINESGLYSLIFSSKLESARRFKRWVTSEVLPAIRKTGNYSVPNETKLLKALTGNVLALNKIQRGNKCSAESIAEATSRLYSRFGISIPAELLEPEKVTKRADFKAIKAGIDELAENEPVWKSKDGLQIGLDPQAVYKLFEELGVLRERAMQMLSDAGVIATSSGRRTKSVRVGNNVKRLIVIME